MPLTREAVVLAVLLSCVPLQYFLTKQNVYSPEQRATKLGSLIKLFQDRFEEWTSGEAWFLWIIALRRKYIGIDYSFWYEIDDYDSLGECPAVEVFQFRSPSEHFAMSPKPRSARPFNVKYRIGQVVKHRKWKYHGVIIGWDIKCKAPEDWIEKMHDGKRQYKSQPNYLLLVHNQGSETDEITYVPQETLELSTLGEGVDHPNLHDYFDYYDGAQYIPSPWLQQVYPLD